jgi:hypothetical protein
MIANTPKLPGPRTEAITIPTGMEINLPIRFPENDREMALILSFLISESGGINLN